MRLFLRDAARDGRADKWHGLLRVGVNAVSRMLLGVMVARAAGAFSFAIYVGLVTVEVLASTLLTAGVLTAIGSIAPRLDATEGNALLRYGLRRAIRISILITALLAACSPVAAQLEIHDGILPLFATSTGAWLCSTATATILVARFRSRPALVGQGLAYLPAFAAVAWADHCGTDPLLALFAGSTGGHLLAVVIMQRALPEGSGEEVRPRVRAEVAAAGRIVLFGSVANSLCTRVQPFVLAAFGGPVAVGLFGAANTLVGPLRVLAGAVGDVLRPRLALHQGERGDPRRASRLIRSAWIALLVCGVLGTIVAAWFGEGIGLRVFGPRFGGLGEVLPAAGCFVLLAAIVHVLVVAMQTQSIEGAAVATRARTVAAVISLLLVAPACSVDGARGAFLSMILGEGLFLFRAVRFLGRTANRTVELVAA
ncbi:MAG: hypothetical protein U1F36_07365 [Planctomycetota bacterium]